MSASLLVRRRKKHFFLNKRTSICSNVLLRRIWCSVYYDDIQRLSSKCHIHGGYRSKLI